MSKKIIESTTEPNKNDLWMNKGVLRHFSSLGWQNISNTIEGFNKILYFPLDINRRNKGVIQLNQREIEQLKSCTMILGIIGNGAMIPFIRGTDGVSFINIQQDLKRQILLYTPSNNTLRYYIESSSPNVAATPTKLGLVKQAPGIDNIVSDATLADTICTFNNLLYSLRDAGILEDS